MKWYHSKNRKKEKEKKKCVGILHAQFTNDEEVYIVTLSGTGYELDVELSNDVKLQIAPYNTVWRKLRDHLKQLQLPGIPKNVIVAEFDAVHKACLAKYKGENKDQKFFEEWRKRLENWIGGWHIRYMKMRETNKKFTVKWLVEQGMKDTYLEQMKVEAPSEEEAEQRCKDVVDFLTECIPEYQPNSGETPLRMKIIEILFTKSPTEITDWFNDELKTKLSQYKTADFKSLCREFMSRYRALLICWDVSCVNTCIKANIRGVDLNICVSHFITCFKDCVDYWQRIKELVYIDLLIKGYANRELMSRYRPLLICWDVSRVNTCIKVNTRGVNLNICARHFKTLFKDCFNYWQKIRDMLFIEYKKNIITITYQKDTQQYQ